MACCADITPIIVGADGVQNGARSHDSSGQSRAQRRALTGDVPRMRGAGLLRRLGLRGHPPPPVLPQRRIDGHRESACRCAASTIISRTRVDGGSASTLLATSRSFGPTEPDDNRSTAGVGGMTPTQVVACQLQRQRQQADRLVAAVGVLLADLAKADRVVEPQRRLVARSHVDLAQDTGADMPVNRSTSSVVEAPCRCRVGGGRVDGDSVEVDEVVVVPTEPSVVEAGVVDDPAGT